jgi:hypothetical protein
VGQITGPCRDPILPASIPTEKQKEKKKEKRRKKRERDGDGDGFVDKKKENILLLHISDLKPKIILKMILMITRDMRRDFFFFFFFFFFLMKKI